MKNNLLIFIFFLSLNVSAETSNEVKVQNVCSIELFSKVYRLENNQNLNSSEIIKKADCENNILNKLSQLVANSSGTVGSDFLKRELLKDFPGMTISLTPRKLSFLELNNVLREQLTSETNLYFLDSKSLNGIRSFGLSENEQIKINCESCNSFGEKNIKVDILNPISNSSHALWFSSKIMAKVKVFKAKRNISFQQKHLESDDFYADEILTSSPENVVTTLNNIHFYKANRTIIQGSAVSNFDLQAVNLINYGTPVNVVLTSQNISLQRTAIPMRSALFGETVELKNPNNNKLMVGKVVDYNKVIIEL